jgi:hypothetical protein
MTGFPGSQVLRDSRIADAGLFFELAQRRGARRLARLDEAFHQLHARARMLERQYLPHRGIPEHHRASLLCRAHFTRSLTLRHLPNFFAKVMPACAGLVDGRDS